MLATIGENGRFGVVAVGDTLDQAQELYVRVQKVIQEEALKAIRIKALPEF
jgi:hypothetical protein